MQGSGGVSASELWAVWVGAIGSALAAIVAVGVYLFDRHKAQAREAKALADSRRRQALHIAVLLDAVWGKLINLQQATGPDGRAHRAVNDLLLPPPNLILEALTDAAAFKDFELESIYGLVSITNHLNDTIVKRFTRDSSGAYVQFIRFDIDAIARTVQASHEVRSGMWKAGGVKVTQEMIDAANAMVMDAQR
jgi:hypothetical protein